MFEKYIDEIEKNGISIELIAEIVAEHDTKKRDMINKYGRYKQDESVVPIFSRDYSVESANNINNKLANDWFSEIIDTKTGYLFGNPVVYKLDRSAKNYDAVAAKIEDFRKANNIDDLNGEWGKFSAICGYDGGLLYIDKDGQERVMRSDPWETIILTRGEVSDPQYGIRYYQKWDDDWHIEFYDDKNKTVYEGSDINAESLEITEEKPHLFDYCPLFGIPNNAELMGDADKVLTLIDAYDRSTSDMNNEVEQFRLAMMLFIGYEPTKEILDAMKEMGALYIPDTEDGSDIKWLVKNLDPKYVDSHLDRLEKNITRFSKHVNFTEAFSGGQVTGPAMRYKLFMLETKAKISERKHEAAMMHMFKTLGSAWAKKNITFDYKMLDCKYNRNIPVNIVDEANAAASLMGVVSHRTAIETLTFVNDVEAEMERIAKEKADMVDLTNIDNNNNTDSGAGGGQ